MDVKIPKIYQGLFLPARYKILYGGRSAARSWSVARWTIALTRTWKLRVLCAREFQKSIDQSVHALLKQQIEKLGLLSEYDIQKYGIYHKATGSEYSFEGIRFNIEAIKSKEGYDIVWVEEADGVGERHWDIIIPTFRNKEEDYPTGHPLKCSEIVMTYNPDLDTDFTHKEFVLKDNSNDPLVQKYGKLVVKSTYLDNPFCPEVIKLHAEGMLKKDPKKYDWVYAGNCRTLKEGAVYGEEIEDLIEEERLGVVPYQPGKPVGVYYDLGRSKRGRMSCIFVQQIGYNLHIIDAHEAWNKDLDYFFNLMQSKGYFYGYVVLPHDAKHHRIGMKASIRKQFQEAGFSVKVVPKLLLEEGILNTRNIWPRIWMDKEKCDELYQALRHYKYEFEKDEITGKDIPSLVPLKDGWTDNYADALRTLGNAMVLWPNHLRKFKPPKEIVIDPMIGHNSNRNFKIKRTGAGWAAK